MQYGISRTPPRHSRADRRTRAWRSDIRHDNDTGSMHAAPGYDHGARARAERTWRDAIARRDFTVPRSDRHTTILDSRVVETDDGLRRDHTALVSFDGLPSVHFASWRFEHGRWRSIESKTFAANVVCECREPCRSIDTPCVASALSLGFGGFAQKGNRP